jgi:hypothetical protein
MASALAFPALAGVTVALVTGCGTTISGHPVDVGGPPQTSRPSASTSARAQPTVPHPTGTDRGGSVDFQAEIGDCVQLGGTNDNATIEKQPCGSRNSNYKVIGKAPTTAQCPSDSDYYYYETLGGVEQGALCLDRDWVVGGCMDIGGDLTQRIDCGVPASKGVRVLNILPNADTVDACADGDGGIVYDQRHYVVCLQYQ